MTSSSPPLVQCNAVSRQYTLSNNRRGWFSRSTDIPTVEALSDVDLSLYRGEIVGCAGPSGSGKSTLLHLLAALDTPTTGTIWFNDTNIATLSPRERTRHRLDHIGIVFQHFHLLDSLSARANVALPLVELGRPKKERRKRATALLEAMGLEDRITHRPPQLSGGEQQRVAIARALITEPDLVIADEPTGELDTQTGERVLTRFRELARELDTAVVVASHDEPTLEIADRLVRMRDGEIITIEDNTPESEKQAMDDTGTDVVGETTVQQPSSNASSEHTPTDR